MTENIARQPAGIPAGGQFAPSAHAEPGITLAAARGYDPEDVAVGILEDLRELPVEWTRELYYGTRKAVQSGETTYEAFLDGLLAKNHGGRCKEHEFDRFDTETYCHDCLTSLMVEARTNPKPAPAPRGVIPVRQYDHHLEKKTIDFDSGDDSSIETSLMTGDEQFEAAVRKLFKAPADAKVEVVMEESEDWSTYTGESSTEITVKCGGREAVYSHMGSFMKALDQADYDAHSMALRFMTADSAPRPLLKGIAAVYLHKEYADPVPVFGKIRNVFSGADGKFMDFLHLDGRQEYLYLSRVSAILETDQSREYNEHPNVLPDSAARPGPVIATSTDPDGGERVVRAVVASHDLENQVREYLRVEDPAAEVEVRFEKVNFYSVEDEEFVISCAGKEVSFHNLETLLRKVAN
jgi:hypothetical protein